MARGDSSRVAVIDIIENDDLQYAARSLLPDTDTGVQCIPIGSHMRRWRLRAQNQPIKFREPRGRHAALSFQGKFMPFGVTEFDQWSQRLQRRIATRYSDQHWIVACQFVDASLDFGRRHEHPLVA